jgi:hypothetical protein
VCIAYTAFVCIAYTAFVCIAYIACVCILHVCVYMKIILMCVYCNVCIAYIAYMCIHENHIMSRHGGEKEDQGGDKNSKRRKSGWTEPLGHTSTHTHTNREREREREFGTGLWRVIIDAQKETREHRCLKSSGGKMRDRQHDGLRAWFVIVDCQLSRLLLEQIPFH